MSSSIYVRKDPSLGMVGVSRAWSDLYVKPSSDSSDNKSSNSNGDKDSKNNSISKSAQLTIQRSATLREKLKYYFAGSCGTVLNVSVGFKIAPPSKLARKLGLLALICIICSMLVSLYRLQVVTNMLSALEGVVFGCIANVVNRLLLLAATSPSSSLPIGWLADDSKSMFRQLISLALVGVVMAYLVFVQLIPSSLLFPNVLEFVVCCLVGYSMQLYCWLDVDIDFGDEKKEKKEANTTTNK